MRRILLVFLFAFTLAGCGDPAREMFETAQFEERQYNRDHAAQLYRQIAEKYPDSPFAVRARERLAELAEGQGAGR